MPPGSRKETPHAFTSTPKKLLLVAVLPSRETEIAPELAPAGTVAVILVVVLCATVADTPLNLTMLLAGIVLKLVPVMVTEVPVGPEIGAKVVMEGGVTNSDRGRDHTPRPPVPAYRVVPLTARATYPTLGNPGAALQLVPLLLETKTPPLVPANKLLPLSVRE